MKRRTAEFVDVVLKDFRLYAGEQRITFEPPTHDGRTGVTLVTGRGGCGKTVLLDALELALWGVAGATSSGRRCCALALQPKPGDDPRGAPILFINHEALGRPRPESSVALTLRVVGSDGPQETLVVRRRWVLKRDGAVREFLAVDVEAGGVKRELRAGRAQRRIDRLLAPDRAPFMFAGQDEISAFGRAADSVGGVFPPQTEELAVLLQSLPADAWRAVSDGVIRAANHMLRECPGVPDTWLLPESAAEGWRGVHEVVPGIWSTAGCLQRGQRDWLGLALVLGGAMASTPAAPLVLDGPGDLIHPHYTDWLEALAGAGHPQLIVANNPEALEFPPLTLLDRVRSIQLVEMNRGRGIGVLDETALTRSSV